MMKKLTGLKRKNMTGVKMKMKIIDVFDKIK